MTSCHCYAMVISDLGGKRLDYAYGELPSNMAAVTMEKIWMCAGILLCAILWGSAWDLLEMDFPGFSMQKRTSIFSLIVPSSASATSAL